MAARGRRDGPRGRTFGPLGGEDGRPRWSGLALAGSSRRCPARAPRRPRLGRTRPSYLAEGGGCGVGNGRGGPTRRSSAWRWPAARGGRGARGGRMSLREDGRIMPCAVAADSDRAGTNRGGQGRRRGGQLDGGAGAGSGRSGDPHLSLPGDGGGFLHPRGRRVGRGRGGPHHRDGVASSGGLAEAGVSHPTGR